MPEDVQEISPETESMQKLAPTEAMYTMALLGDRAVLERCGHLLENMIEYCAVHRFLISQDVVLRHIDEIKDVIKEIDKIVGVGNAG